MLLGASCYISGEEPGVRIVKIGSPDWSMLITDYTGFLFEIANLKLYI